MTRTYGQIALEQNEWVMTGVEPHVSIKLKNLFKKIPVYSTGPYRFANSAESCADIEWFMSRYPLAVSEDDLRELRRQKTLFFDTQAEMERILAPNFIPHNCHTKEGQQLRVYQSQAIDSLTKLLRALSSATPQPNALIALALLVVLAAIVVVLVAIWVLVGR